jgi:hypothetical protein
MVQRGSGEPLRGDEVAMWTPICARPAAWRNAGELARTSRQLLRPASPRAGATGDASVHGARARGAVGCCPWQDRRQSSNQASAAASHGHGHQIGPSAARSRVPPAGVGRFPALSATADRSPGTLPDKHRHVLCGRAHARSARATMPPHTAPNRLPRNTPPGLHGYAV